MNKYSRLILIGGVLIAGAAASTYRSYKLKKFNEQLKEAEIIDIEPSVEQPQK